MKIIRNLLCILLSCSMLMPLYTVFADEPVPETVSAENQKSLDMLTWLDIMSADMTENPLRKVTRAELAAMICKIVFGSDNGLYGGGSDNVTNDKYLDILYNAVFEGEGGVYEDVLFSDSYYSAIRSLKDMNIMVGYNNRFYPQDNVTYNEAVTALVLMLGYDIRADKKGKYPDEYLNIARSIDLDKYVNNRSQHELTIAELAQIINNAVHTDMVFRQINGNQMNYEIAEGDTPLTEYMGICEGEGLFEATSASSLFGEYTGDEMVQISGEVYAGDMWEDFLGYYVNFYYTEEDETIVYMEKQNKVTEIEIASYELDSFENNIYRYTKLGKRNSQKAVLENGATIVYNGRIPEITKGKELYIPENGKVKLIDNNGDRKYDVVFVWEYETYIVKTVDVTDTLTVLDYNQKHLSLSETNGDVIKLYKNGVKATASDINVFDILLVAKSEEGDGERLVTVVIGDEIVPGSATFKGEYVRINGEDYPVSPDYKQDKTSGIEYDFYLDALGQVAFYDKDSNAENEYVYGIYVKMLMDDSGELPPSIKVFTQDGAWEILKLSKRIVFDGTPVKNSYDITQTDSVLRTSADGPKPQMIGFKLNEKGEIREIDTLEMGANEDKWENLRSTKIYNREINAKYLENGRSFGYHTALATDTILFRVPMSESKEIIYDSEREKEYTVRKTTGDSTWRDSYDTYYVQFFNKTKAGSCNLMIWYKPVGNDDLDSWNTKPVIVDNISEELGADGEVVIKINGWQDLGQKVSFTVNKTLVNTAKQLERGDIIYYQINGDNEIAYLSRFSPYDNAGDYSQTAYHGLWYGFVSALDSEYNIFRVCYDENAPDILADECTTVHNMKGMSWEASRYEAHVMIYDRKSKTVREGAWSDIYEGREILLYVRATAPCSVILFE